MLVGGATYGRSPMHRPVSLLISENAGADADAAGAAVLRSTVVPSGEAWNVMPDLVTPFGPGTPPGYVASPAS